MGSYKSLIFSYKSLSCKASTTITRRCSGSYSAQVIGGSNAANKVLIRKNCGRRESNPQPVRDRLLRPARMPVPPLPLNFPTQSFRRSADVHHQNISGRPLMFW